MRHFLRLLALSGTVCLGCLLLMFGGCDKQARKQIQCVSDARAGAQAIKAIPADQPIPVDLARGLADNVLAATEHLPDLPAPTMTPLEIGKDPAAYAKTAAISAASPPPYVAPKATAPAVDTLAPLKDDCRLAIEWGAIIGVLGTILWGASLFIDPAAIAGGVAGWVLGKVLGLSFIWRLAASAGGVAVVVGAAGLWALDHPWVIVGAIAAALAWVGLVHHKDMGAAWHRILGLLHATVGKLHGHSTPAPKPTPPSTLIGK